MKKIEIICTLDVCDDCIQWHANGETDPNWTQEETEDFLSRFGTAATDDPDHWLALNDLDDHDFSWRACECCGSSLGGNRHFGGMAVLGYAK